MGKGKSKISIYNNTFNNNSGTLGSCINIFYRKDLVYLVNNNRF